MDTQETMYTAVLISSVVIGLIIIFFLFSIIGQQRRNMEFQRRNILAVITTLEEERTRMSTDLHDNLGPLLTYIKFQVDGSEGKNPEDAEQLKDACDKIDEVIGRMRLISKNLMPSVLARKGLVPAMQEYVHRHNESLDPPIQLEVAMKSRPDPGTSVNLFRILQEIIQNTIRHARARELRILLGEEEKHFSIICQDNGIGFDHQKITCLGSGLGLRNVHSRVAIMKGRLEIDSALGKGTSYYIRIPKNMGT